MSVAAEMRKVVTRPIAPASTIARICIVSVL